VRAVTVRIPAGVAGFTEDKEAARTLRITKILPALESSGRVILDFKHVRVATQSFIHALIGEALKRHGEAVLDRIDFKNCSQQLKKIIPLVIDYSLGGFQGPKPTPVSSRDR
jgi:hypothetical protein